MLRQSYVNICNQLIVDRSIALEEFAKYLLMPLLALKSDRVPNVRLVLARVVNFRLKHHGNLFDWRFIFNLHTKWLSLFLYCCRFFHQT